MQEMAIAGRGMALLPAWTVGRALRERKLVRLLPGWEARPTRAVPAVRGVYPPKKKTVASKVRAFLDFYAKLYARKRYTP